MTVTYQGNSSGSDYQPGGTDATGIPGSVSFQVNANSVVFVTLAEKTSIGLQTPALGGVQMPIAGITNWNFSSGGVSIGVYAQYFDTGQFINITYNTSAQSLFSWLTFEGVYGGLIDSNFNQAGVATSANIAFTPSTAISTSHKNTVVVTVAMTPGGDQINSRNNSFTEAQSTTGVLNVVPCYIIVPSSGSSIQNSYSPDFVATTDMAWATGAIYSSKTEPTSPGSLAPTNITSSSFDANWTAPSSDGGYAVDGYYIKFATSAVPPGYLFNTVTYIGNGATLTKTFTGLQPDTNYTYYIYAHNQAGQSPNSTPRTARTLPSTSVPGMPANGGATNVTPTSFSANWSPPSSDGGAAITDYKVTFTGTHAPSGFTLGTAQSLSTTGGTYGFTGCVPNTDYTYTIAAVNSVGTGPGSNQITARTSVAPNPPLTPGPPTASRGTVTAGVNLSWTAPGDGGSPILSYDVTASPTATLTSSAASSGSPGTVITFTGTSVTNLTVSVASPGVQGYGFAVRARNAYGVSAYSAPSPPIIPPQFISRAHTDVLSAIGDTATRIDRVTRPLTTEVLHRVTDTVTQNRGKVAAVLSETLKVTNSVGRSVNTLRPTPVVLTTVDLVNRAGGLTRSQVERARSTIDTRTIRQGLRRTLDREILTLQDFFPQTGSRSINLTELIQTHDVTSRLATEYRNEMESIPLLVFFSRNGSDLVISSVDSIYEYLFVPFSQPTLMPLVMPFVITPEPRETIPQAFRTFIVDAAAGNISAENLYSLFNASTRPAIDLAHTFGETVRATDSLVRSKGFVRTTVEGIQYILDIFHLSSGRDKVISVSELLPIFIDTPIRVLQDIAELLPFIRDTAAVQRVRRVRISLHEYLPATIDAITKLFTHGIYVVQRSIIGEGNETIGPGEALPYSEDVEATVTHG